jgi:hypothetical protein
MSYLDDVLSGRFENDGTRYGPSVGINSRQYQRRLKGYPEPTRPEAATCEICGHPPGGRFAHLDLDHCHDTGKFRGWLCRQCNIALGMAKDSPACLRALAAYLEKSRE